MRLWDTPLCHPYASDLRQLHYRDPQVAAKSMTPLDKVFMLSTEDRLDERTLQAILMSGHSRIPVHRWAAAREGLGRVGWFRAPPSLLAGFVGCMSAWRLTP